MVKVGMNFITEARAAGGEGRRMYTKSFDLPAVPRPFDKISDVGAHSGAGLLPGTVTGVTWTLVVQEWVAYVDVQTAVQYDDHSHDA